MLEHRQSHRRLTVSMAASSAVLVALLELLSLSIKNTDRYEHRRIEVPGFLTVHLVPQNPERDAGMRLPDDEFRTPSIAEILETDPRSDPQLANGVQSEPLAVPDEHPETSIDPTPIPDWNTIGQESAKQTINERFAREKARSAMWRSTGSVMFEDTGEFDVLEPKSIIADREFRVPVGVLGIGITIGGCFIGIPLAGIPVENRTVGPTLIYCPDIFE